MKKQKKFERKLKFKKETVARLNHNNMNNVNGGISAGSNPECCCNTSDPPETKQNPCPVPFTEAPISECC
jgi:hypothetical protein